MKPIWILVNQLDLEVLNDEQRRWVIKVIAGAIMADGVLADEEKPHLEALLNLIGTSASLKQLVWSIIDSKKPPELESLQLPAEYAIKLYKVALEIAAADLELHPYELKFLVQLASKLEIDRAKARRYIKTTLQMMRIESLVHIKDDLKPGECEWIATLIIQLIWADGIVEQREIKFLSHVFELVCEDEELLASLREHPESKNIQDLPTPQFTPDFASTLVRYCIEMTICASGLEPFGLAVAEQAAKQLGLSTERFSSLTTETRAVLEG